MEEVVQVFQLIILMAIFTMLFFVGLLGNGMVIFTIAKFKHLRWPINVLIANICFCNNLILILGVPWYVFQLSLSLKKKYQTFNCYSLVAIMVVSTSCINTCSHSSGTLHMHNNALENEHHIYQEESLFNCWFCQPFCNIFRVLFTISSS